MMAYISLIILFAATVLFGNEVQNQFKTGLNVKRLITYVTMIIVCIIGSNYINNKFLAEHKAKPYVKELQTKVYQEPLNNLQLKPMMSTEERQERTDVLLDRKQITDKLYD